MSLNILFCVPDKWFNEGSIFYWPDLKAGIQADLEKHCKFSETVSTLEQYDSLTEEVRASFDILVVQMGSIAPDVIDRQMNQNKNLKWVHSISAGIDGYVAVKSFKDSEIPLTNAKGAYSEVLGEFVALGVLYHAKKLERFMTQ
jgi:phosphoglycerate dehydrogenase-like enzyme